MALTKDKHYWTQLRTAITAGQWDSEAPGKDLKGYALDWANLLRKFNKHCPGQNEFAEVVSQTHHLYLQLAAGQQESAIGDSQHAQASRLGLGDDNTLTEERLQEGQTGYDVLKALPSPSEVSPAKHQIYFGLNRNFQSTLLILAYYAYSLSRPSECLDILSKVKDLKHPLKRITTSKFSASIPNVSQPGTDHPSPGPNVQDGRAWSFIENIRSICLKGISHLPQGYHLITHPFRDVIREAAPVRFTGLA